MRIRRIGILLALAFVVTLGVVVGTRVSAEALAVMVGVIAGVAASLPTSLVVMWFALRQLPPAPSRAPQPTEPRIIYIQAAPPPPTTTAAQAGEYLTTLTSPRAAPSAPRQFTGLNTSNTAPQALDAARSVAVIGGP